MAVRNNLYLFAWLCAIGLPLGLQFLSGMLEEVRLYLGNYYGVFSIYIFFTMTYGIATVFVGYYLTASFRKAGTIDLLRLSRLKPFEVLGGVFLSLQHVLLPPLIAALAGMLVYLSFAGAELAQARLGWFDLLGAMFMQVCNMLVLCGIALLGLLRNEAPLGALAFMLVLPLNTLPVVLIFVLHLPQWVYSVGLFALLLVLALFANLRLARLWPAALATAK